MLNVFQAEPFSGLDEFMFQLAYTESMGRRIYSNVNIKLEHEGFELDKISELSNSIIILPQNLYLFTTSLQEKSKRDLSIAIMSSYKQGNELYVSGPSWPIDFLYSNYCSRIFEIVEKNDSFMNISCVDCGTNSCHIFGFDLSLCEEIMEVSFV